MQTAKNNLIIIPEVYTKTGYSDSAAVGRDTVRPNPNYRQLEFGRISGNLNMRVRPISFQFHCIKLRRISGNRIILLRSGQV